MGGQIAVPELEPVGLHAIAHQFLHGVPSFVTLAPAALGVHPAAQGIHAGVQIRADTQPVDPGVVADVDDSAQLVVGVRVGRIGSKLAQAEQLLDPEQEAGAADSTGQNGDLHIAGQYLPAPITKRWLRVTLDTPGPNHNRTAEILLRDDMEMRRHT
ncbi:Uncharacterised protein [Mycobacterium tuberculosis]|uniref:Uncharacterized protein n=2 Tax=Mycobacterium tuberculosis TaxID=1773 RepID=A0A0T9YF75_MYCTX|nr:Uncharacterised protein [Mycobacterium tuberculosis]CNV37449.1 Uncharacterised protein [Mycobacterium tuberculosis]CNV46866.1 Uncharacterised protein [Mycobacterium tuberculosis]COW55910.1 Uncharacterised protein [Mycobacterium tuberculosis]COY36229.1 Uncharacterised protein [Mycobacterium tuberculosis]